MNKLLYEVKNTFKPIFYMVMMGDARKGHWRPVNFCEASGTFCYDSLSSDPHQEGEPLQVYDYETVMKLLSHHTLNSSHSPGIRIAPVYVPEILKGPSECPYLNTYARLDGIKDSIKAEAEFCRTEDPDWCNDSFDLPPSLGGYEVVPAVPEPILSCDRKAVVA